MNLGSAEAREPLRQAEWRNNYSLGAKGDIGHFCFIESFPIPIRFVDMPPSGLSTLREATASRCTLIDPNTEHCHDDRIHCEELHSG